VAKKKLTKDQEEAIAAEAARKLQERRDRQDKMYQPDDWNDEYDAPIYGGVVGDDDPITEPVGGWGSWRPQIKERRIPTKFDDAAKGRCLAMLRMGQSIPTAARASGVVPSTVYDHMEREPEFQEAVDEAREHYNKIIFNELQRRVLEGLPKPIIGGPDKDTVVAVVMEKDSNLLMSELRRRMPEYNEKKDLNVTGAGGVIALPETPATDEELQDWADNYEYPDLPENTVGLGDAIDKAKQQEIEE